MTKDRGSRGETAPIEVMTPDRWELVQQVYEAATAIPPDERPTFIARRCGDDEVLRREVDSLLAHTHQADEKLHQLIGSEAMRLGDEAARTYLGRRLGPYEVVELIGVGGMGAVYLASRADDEYRRRVAIKILHAGITSGDAIARLRDERQILAELDHPGIVKLLDGARTEDGLPYLVMEYIEGMPLVRHAVERALSTRERVELVVQMCDAVRHAHAKRVIHRDLKPSNVLVDLAGRPKLLDFGIAKLLDGEGAREAVTRTGDARFTPEYASPEQVRGEPVSPASDVYALGAILYELLAGRPPLSPTGNAAEIVRVVSEVDPPRPSTVSQAARRREIVGDLDTIVLKALHKDPSQRYAQVNELADDLRRWLEGQPVLARPPTLGYRLRKSMRRHRKALLVAGLASAVASTLTITLVSDTQVATDEVSCAGSGRAATVWSSARRAAVRSAMLAVPSPAADDAWRAVEQRFDRYVAEWAAMHVQACEATHRIGVQSEALLDLRMRCLDDKLDELDGLVSLLQTADRELVGKASRAAHSLGSIASCADTVALTAPFPIPSEPDRRRGVDDARHQLARSRALGYAGRYQTQLAEVEALLPTIRQLAYAPLLGDALYVQATALDRTASFARAADVMREASYQAERGGDRKLAARARVELVWLVGHQLGDAQRGLEYAREAEARIAGLGGDAVLSAQLESNLDIVLTNLGKLDEAMAHARRALELREKALGPDDVLTAIARVNVAVGLARAGRRDEALALYHRALDTYHRQVGQHHPLYAQTLFNIADLENDLGRLEAATTNARRARELLVAAVGPEHNLIASVDHVLALIAYSQQRFAAAAEHARGAVELGTKLRGPEHVMVGHYTLTLAAILIALDRASEAVDLARRALAIFEKHADRNGAARARTTLGTALDRRGDRAGARVVIEEAIAVLEATPDDDPVALAAARFALAKLSGADPKRARTLAIRARDGADATLRTAIDAWLAEHPEK
jgi:serine/threonine protein kinase/tetratricopeptide (TPR) repeat protein